MSEWETVRLGDITEKIGSGATPRGGKEVYLDERINFALVRSQNVFDRCQQNQELRIIHNVIVEATFKPRKSQQTTKNTLWGEADTLR